MMEKGIWQEIEELYMEFQQLGISQSVDYEKYYLCGHSKIRILDVARRKMNTKSLSEHVIHYEV